MDVFNKNLNAIRKHHPQLAEQLSAIEPASLEWSDSKAGPPTATRTDLGPRPVALASKYDPVKEAQKLVEAVDHAKTACTVILGFGLGYHVDEVVNHVGPRDLVIVYEPDLAQLRGVLEKLDYTRWLSQNGLILAGPDASKSMLLGRIERRSATPTLGTQLITHPASRQRHGEAFNDFGKLVTETLAFCRTNVATALVNASRTVSNLTNNLAQYAAGATIAELENAAKGYPAICVGAGPSLVKNLDLLTDPEIRKNVVVIGVQTTLKPMLQRGIRPDFVTALDYSAICTRFYEDLPELPDVTLVVEPKCHPAIIAAYPGPVRVCPSDLNDKLLGDMARPMPKIKAGTTVAHLSFYLAQLLGCDPIIFIGQDLGFSDGLYYAPGTAVHQVWEPELGAFNTIETMEWTRVVRMRGNLRRAEDVHGRPIFTDEQMSTYLGQFERDFAEAKDAGLTVIDATEGGMPKQHTTLSTLRDALDEYATKAVPTLPKAEGVLSRERLSALRGLLDGRIDRVKELKRVTLDTSKLLKRLREHQHTPKKADKYFKQVQKNTAKVHGELKEAFELVSSVNTVGTFRRERADRGIHHTEHADDYERQLAQIDRDLDNMDFIDQACDEALTIFNEAQQRLLDAIDESDGVKKTNEIAPATRRGLKPQVA
ncbi:MAG: 6-hydroxymethylpterin diphosphokinase MptE-like protein [Phycisphaeraceae bacterium]